ncbi:MAG: helix-turn-helix transcriptional regulator [Cetobacterium sp.]
MKKVRDKIGFEEDADEKVLELTRQGKLGKEIALELGISKNTVDRIKRKLGIQKPRNPSKETPVDADEKVLELTRQGKLGKEIALELGISKNTVSKIKCKYKKIEELSDDKLFRKSLKNHGITKMSYITKISIPMMKDIQKKIDIKVEQEKKYICRICGERKAYEEMKLNNKHETGLATHCKSCHNKSSNKSMAKKSLENHNSLMDEKFENLEKIWKIKGEKNEK